MIWKKGDIITQGRYNKVKNSYAGLPKSVALHMTLTSPYLAVLDKTKDEVLEFLRSGYIVYIIIDSSNQGESTIDYITFVSDSTVETLGQRMFSVGADGQISLHFEVQD